MTRREDHRLQVRIPGRPPTKTRPWVREVGDAGAAIDLVQQVLVEVFEAKRDAPLDVAHGSHRAEVEARRTRSRPVPGAPQTKPGHGGYL